MMFVQEEENFRQIFKMPQMDWCELMAGAKKTKGMSSTIFEIMKGALDGLIQECPYEGLYSVFNAKLARKTLSFLPKGTFKIVFKVFFEGIQVFKPAMTIEFME